MMNRSLIALLSGPPDLPPPTMIVFKFFLSLFYVCDVQNIFQVSREGRALGYWAL
jgi:hypothetical protein